VYVTAFHPGAPPPESEWVAVTGEAGSDAHPWWSPDGSLLYFVSPRDGFPCIWTQRLDPATRRPEGAPAEFYHFHGARQILNRNIMGPGIARDKLVFTLLELTGNVWLAR
jgi:hypothetical protein